MYVLYFCTRAAVRGTMLALKWPVGDINACRAGEMHYWGPLGWALWGACCRSSISDRFRGRFLPGLGAQKGPKLEPERNPKRSKIESKIEHEKEHIFGILLALSWAVFILGCKIVESRVFYVTGFVTIHILIQNWFQTAFPCNLGHFGRQHGSKMDSKSNPKWAQNDTRKRKTDDLKAI